MFTVFLLRYANEGQREPVTLVNVLIVMLLRMPQNDPAIFADAAGIK